MIKKPVEIVLEQVTLPFEKLHDYQEEDVNNLAYLESCGLILGLGLGKTIVSLFIGVYKLIMEAHEVVIVLCPASLVTQWEIAAKELSLDVLAYRGAPAKRKKLNLKQDIIIMSYQIFQKDYACLKDLKMYFIIDEATVMCNPQNKLYKMINGGQISKVTKIPGKLKPLKEVTKYENINSGVVLLSATPINNPMDSYGWIETRSPGIYSNKSQFERIHIAETDFLGRPTEYNNLDFLHDNMMMSSSQRLVTDHLELPPLVMKVVKYDLSPKHLKLYKDFVKKRVIELEGEVLVRAIQFMQFYHAAQKLVINPEFGGLEEEPVGIEILDGIVSSVDAFLIFCNYKLSNAKVMSRYDIGGVYGEVTAKKKDEYIKDFQSGELRGLACHSKSSGYGLNLQRTGYVIFPEIPVTPRDLLQSVGRAYRQGQKETVVVTIMVARGTIQESLLRKFLDKGDLMAQVLKQEMSLKEELSKNVVVAGKRSKDDVINSLLGR